MQTFVLVPQSHNRIEKGLQIADEFDLIAAQGQGRIHPHRSLVVKHMTVRCSGVVQGRFLYLHADFGKVPLHSITKREL